MRKNLAGGRAVFLGSHVLPPPPTGLPEFAMAGRSNVGKSTCINALLGIHGAARVSKQPGRTRTINLFQVEDRYVLVDLPGYGYARVPRHQQLAWKDMVESYLRDRPGLLALVLLLDPRRGLGPDDAVLLRAADSLGLAVLPVATKVDKLKPRARRAALDALKARPELAHLSIQAISARTGQGVPQLKARIESLLPR